MSDLWRTSVPGWALSGSASGAPEAGGSALLLVGMGAAGRGQIAAWVAGAGATPVTVVEGDGADDVADAFARAVADARVGLRVRIAGPAGDCLVLRGMACAAGLEDDEIHVAPTGAGAIRISCAHCRATTSAVAAIGDVVTCSDCGRGLVVYYHVSRRTGCFLGYMLDAEEAGV